MLINRICILGRLTQEPAYKSGEKDGRKWSVARISIRNEWKQKTKNGFTDSYVVIQTDVWNKQADEFKSLKKGALISIEGKIKTESWKDAKSNMERSIIKIDADSVVYIEEMPQEPVKKQEEGGGEWDDQDLPF